MMIVLIVIIIHKKKMEKGEWIIHRIADESPKKKYEKRSEN